MKRIRANSEFVRSKGRHRGPSRDADNRGSTLIEAAVVFPVIILVIMGTIEIGLAFKDFLTVGALSREGARVAALAGRDSEADCAVLIGLGTLATPSDLDKIDDVQIYRAAEGTGTQGVTNTWVHNPGEDPSQCNLPAQLNDGWSMVGATNYPPGSRNTTVGSTPLDIIGVRVTMTRSWVTGFPPFRGSFTLDETTITRVEPEAFE